MLSPDLIGALIIGIPAIVVAYFAFFWRRRPIFWFVVALALVGTGYLYSTGALADIANLILGSAPSQTPAVTPTP